MNAIEVTGVSLTQGFFRLHDIHAAFPEHQITAIVGQNGSGKSTLLKTIARLLRPAQGDIQIHQQPAAAFSAKQFARRVSMLPQSKDTLPDLTVQELIAYGRSPYKRLFDHRMTSDDKQAIALAMEMTGTDRHKDRLFYTLSGGEQQKARIAMALAQKTDILLLDEPTTFLDIAHQLDVMDMLRSINEHSGITIIMVLHDLQQAAAYCHFMIAMKSGRIAATGNPLELLTPAFLQNVYQLEAQVKFLEGYPLIIPDTGPKNRRNDR